MKDILLSVIVPVYNCGQYLKRCLDSIIGQTYKNLDIILINDGSTDCSGKICDEYTEKDKRIRVIHKENEGLVEARKCGVRQALGSYVAFVDADDWMDNIMYEKMLEGLGDNTPDVITSGIIYERDDSSSCEIDLVEEGGYDREEILKKIIPVMMYDKKFQRRGITASVCNKIFSKGLLEQFLYMVNSELRHGEDAVITYPAIVRAGKVRIISKAWYHYRQHQESMIHTHNWESFRLIGLLKNDLEKLFLEAGFKEKLQEQINLYLAIFLRRSIWCIYGIDVRQNIIPFYFPYGSVPRGSKIILYGAGAVGTSYQRCLNNNDYVSVVAWVDRDYLQYHIVGKTQIEAPQCIKEKEFDYIVVAVDSENIAESIQKWLMEQGINKNRIIYEKPKKTNFIN